MVTREDYSAVAVQAARSVIVELMHLLAEYREQIVLVGGWVPDLLFPNPRAPHVGSMDVDLALDHRQLREQGYQSIRELLLRRGYEQGSQPFIFHRTCVAAGRSVRVEVDLLAGEYEGTGKGRRHQRTQGVLARKARGCDLAFELAQEVTVEAELPEGGRDAVTCRVAAIVPFLVMKAMALDARLSEKDAWDVYYCLLNYPGGPDALVAAVRPHREHGLVREGLDKIAKHFASPDHLGPVSVAAFEQAGSDDEEHSFLRRDAHERVQHLLQGLDVT